jgi:acetyltransferase-like isoleucine patch superfamily enzyme
LDARSGLTIGENVNLSNEVMIWSLHHDYNDPDFAAIGAPVIIEDYAWLCSRCIILPGVTIGKGAVVAAGAVVSRNVLPYTVVGGIPAKVIASRSSNLTYQLGKGIVPII